MAVLRLYIVLMLLMALFLLKSSGDDRKIEEDPFTEEAKLKQQHYQEAQSQIRPKSQKALERISKHLSYTVYSNEIQSGFKSFILDPSEASIALAWKKKTKGRKKQQRRQRTARALYRHDTRSIILSPTQKRTFPFNTVAQVHPGCSGTVIGHRYILTAAECIHDGSDLLNTVDKLRVGLYDQDVAYDPREGDKPWTRAITWHTVSKVFVPNGWRWRLDSNRYNYAVLRVSNAHFNSCMGLEGNADLEESRPNRIHFSSFERLNRQGEPRLMYRYCHMEQSSTMYIYERCDATAEARGAGMYFRFWKGPEKNWDRKIIAVKSNKQQRINVTGVEELTAVGKDLRITPLVFAQICFWVSDDPESCGKGLISNPCLTSK
ncbi:putative serine protease 23-like [Apostichopus japonicus]|uniref:Putative serine protease 23-like n=1 Tax=Stichopus japonicus TaxID=307972 RepID=A0A2G8JSZ9_STIJA|nr:putative serine protease 23-like [Apostichopus japonicus]